MAANGGLAPDSDPICALPEVALTTPCTAVQLLDDPLSAVDPRVGRILFNQCIGNSGIMAGEMTGQQGKHALAACLAWPASTERPGGEPFLRDAVSLSTL